MASFTPSRPYLPDVTWGSGTPARADIQAVAAAAENAPLRVIYGEVRVGAQVADVLVYQGRLVVIAVWGEGPTEAIGTVWMGDEVSTATATHYLGTSGQTADATLVAAYAAAGVAYTDTLADVAYSVFSVAAETTGVPQFAALVKGRKCYDPRTGLTAWTDNPSLCLADFVASQSYGKGEPVDYTTVGAAADANDFLLGGQKRRTLNLVIDTVSESRQWAETLRVYAGCWAIPGDAGVKLMADRPDVGEYVNGGYVSSGYFASTFAFTASNIVAGSMKLRKRGLRNIPTVMEVSYTDTTLIPYATKTATAYAPGVLAGTTPRRESSISLPGITRYAQAYREALERLNHFLLEDLEASWTAFDEALGLEAGGVVTVTHPIGLTAKLMRLTAPPTSSAPGRWEITAREYDPAAYSDIVQAEPTYADTALPNPAAPPALTGLVAVEEVYQLDNGTYASRLAVTWDAADYAYLSEYRVEVYQGAALVQAAPANSATYRSPAVAEGLEYVVKVAAVTSIGAVGVWSQYNITPLGKYIIPGNVPSLTVFEAGGTVYGACQPAIDIDIWRYEWRYGAVGGTWETSILIDRVDALRITSVQIPVGAWTIYVKAIDSVQQYSAIAANAPVTVTSDAASFLVDTYDSTSPTLTNMAEYSLAPTDSNRYFVTEDGVAFGTKFSAAMATYTAPLATYHSSITSTWLGEGEDFGLILGGQWTGEATVDDLSGTHISSMGFSDDGSAYAYTAGLSHKKNSRFSRLKHEALTTATLRVTIPTQSILVDAIPRSEQGTGTSSAAGPVTITLDNIYVALKKLTLTPMGDTARSAVFDAVVLGATTTFDVYIFNDAGVKISSSFMYEWQGV